jgi:flagellar biosynthesis/type III secretory pathway M-ring protein FliF/YscJ
MFLVTASHNNISIILVVVYLFAVAAVIITPFWRRKVHYFALYVVFDT